MSKKTLNIEGIKNELEGASLYFTKPPTPPPPAIEPVVFAKPVPSSEAKPAPEPKIRQPSTKVVVQRVVETQISNDGKNERTVEPTNERKIVQPLHRAKIRHTFDIYADQLLSLREIALDQEKMFGERVLLGDLAQQALDMLIAKEKNK